MEAIQQVRDDLQYVKAAVKRRDSSRGPMAIYWVWAAYVLIGYAMLDLRPAAAPIFFAIGGPIGGILSLLISKRHQRRTGEASGRSRRAMGHFFGGVFLAVFFTFALAITIPDLRGLHGSQVTVVMIGLVYFLAGVHFDRNFLWLGPLMMAGGAGVSLIPHYGWTTLGAVIALGLVLPTLISRRVPASGV